MLVSFLETFVAKKIFLTRASNLIILLQDPCSHFYLFFNLYLEGFIFILRFFNFCSCLLSRLKGFLLIN